MKKVLIWLLGKDLLVAFISALVVCIFFLLPIMLLIHYLVH